MAKSYQTFKKRQRERQRQEKAQLKRERRAQRRQEKKTSDGVPVVAADESGSQTSPPGNP